MAGLEYHDIGHDPAHGEIAIWTIDDRGGIHEDRRRAEAQDAGWLDWSHENSFPEVKLAAAGRVEIDRRAGSIHLSDPDLGLRPTKLIRLLDALDRRFPNTRWFLFGSGFKGEPAHAALAPIAA